MTHHEVMYERCLASPAEGVVEVVKATKEDHGFDGYLGICVGHPNMLQILNVAAQEKTNQECLLNYLKEEAKRGSKMTAQDILAVWEGKKENPEPVTVVAKEAAAKNPEPVTVVAKKTATKTVSPGTNHRSPPTTPTVELAPKPASVPAITPTTAPPTTPVVATPKARGSKKSTPRAAPATPMAAKTKKRPVEDLAPGVRSPDRMANGLHCSGCNHDNLKGLIGYERNHFNTNLCSQKNYPGQCSGCKLSLPKTKDPKACVEIKGVFQVRCCHNSINHRDHPCVFALCHKCWVESSSSKPSPKKQRVSRSRGALILPGEMLLPDGTVGVSV